VGDVFKGTVNTGIKKVTKVLEFDKNVEKQQPLPNACAF